MPALLRKASLGAQVIGLSALCLAAISIAALAVVLFDGRNPDIIFRLKMIAALAAAALAGLCATVWLVRRIMLPLHAFRAAFADVAQGQLESIRPEELTHREAVDLAHSFNDMVAQLRESRVQQAHAEAMLATRTAAVDRLLQFSQTVQGAGQSEQVYHALSHFLHKELGLAGVVVLTTDPQAIPPVAVNAAAPDGFVIPNHTVGEMDCALCPAMRQDLCKEFGPEASPIRCVLDRNLSLGERHAALCIPFHVGRKVQGVAHMLLPAEQAWTKARRQLAETYVHAAASSLMALHLVEEAERQSLTDPLTGLYNRHSMERLMQREVALCERHDHALSLVMVDMDHFKGVNDTYGHAAGDHMLRAFADCVRMTLRKTDLAFRFGGDEFCIALPQTTVAQAQQVVQKLRQAFAAVDFSHAITRLDKQPTLSIGVVQRSKSTNVLTLSNLLSAADQALYEAKSANRNCVRVYSPPQAA